MEGLKVRCEVLPVVRSTSSERLQVVSARGSEAIEASDEWKRKEVRRTEQRTGGRAGEKSGAEGTGATGGGGARPVEAAGR